MRCSNSLNRGFLGLALLASVAVAFAQGGGAGGGQGRRGGRNNNSELGLAMRKDVQKDLSVTTDEATKLTELNDKLRAERRAAGGGGGQRGGGGGQGGAPDPAALERAQKARDEQHKAIAGILTDGQMVRLHEISIQLRGNRALLDADVQKSLGLSTDQVTKVTELNTKMRDANREIGQKARDNELTREDAQTAMQNNNKIMDGELAKVLTADQASKLKDMGGKPFAADPPSDGG